jgi:hypothetical protein
VNQHKRTRRYCACKLTRSTKYIQKLMSGAKSRANSTGRARPDSFGMASAQLRSPTLPLDLVPGLAPLLIPPFEFTATIRIATATPATMSSFQAPTSSLLGSPRPSPTPWSSFSHHYFVLTSAGKPVYAFCGAEAQLAAHAGVMTTLMAILSAASNDRWPGMH